MSSRASQPSVDPRTRAMLEEAIREIHVIAGLGDEQPWSPVIGGDGAERHVKTISVGVTSPDYGDGKTTISMALAASLAHDFDTNVTLVDADFHTHSIAREFGLGGRRGLTDVLAGKAPVVAATHRVPGGTMAIVPAGIAVADPARLARSGNLGPALEEIKASSSYVVVDLPATLRSMNAPALAQSCDAVVVVVRHGKTSRQDLDRTLHLLKSANVIGVVVNRHHSSVPRWLASALGLSS